MVPRNSKCNEFHVHFSLRPNHEEFSVPWTTLRWEIDASRMKQQNTRVENYETGQQTNEQ